MTTFEYSRQLFRRSLHAFAPAALAVLLLGGCSEPVETLDPAEPTPVNFTAGLRTRALHETNQWSKDDLLGIFMVPAGGTVSQAHTGGNNRIYKFTDPATGTIAPMDDKPMYYPGSEKVDFIAYHFGGGSLNNNNLISLSSMKRFGWDLLYAKTENADRKSGPVNLAFSRMLGKVRVNIIKGTEMENNDFLWMDATLSGMPGSGKIDFNTGTLHEMEVTDIEMESTTAGQGFVATLEANVLPHEAGQFTGRTISFESSRMTKRTWNIPDDNDIPAGKVRIYNLTISAKTISCSSCVIKDWTINDNGTGDATKVDNSQIIEKVLIKAGTFRMGSPDSDPNANVNEKPRHWVRLTRDFYMGKYEVTRVQYAKFLNAMGIKPQPTGINVLGNVEGYGEQVLFEKNKFGWTPKWNEETSKWEATDDIPMINVSWYGAKAFADWVGGRLPTEAEWEYACRAGTETYFFFGDNYAVIGDYAVYHGNQQNDGPSRVGSKKPNPWGLYDMHGNIDEWCLDGYSDYPTADTEAEAVVDPLVPTGGQATIRSNSFNALPQSCRSAARDKSELSDTFTSYGFRVVFD